MIIVWNLGVLFGRNECIILRDRYDVIKYVEVLLKEYFIQFYNVKFDGIISLFYVNRLFLKVFIWCFISYYNIKIICYCYNIEFRCWRWMDDFEN